MKDFSPPNGLDQNIQSFIAFFMLVFFLPLFIIIACLIKLTSSGPVFFKQKRVGKNGKIFIIYKFRTMKVNNIGSKITASDDSRITKIGSYLRILKLDELPQLWNIFNKTMSFVGPRPEVEQYVDFKLPIWHKILSVRPGLTDPIMIQFRNEETLLDQVKGNREFFYKEYLLPYKLKGQLNYLKKRSWISDIKIIFITIFLTLMPSLSKSPTIEKIMKSKLK